MKFTISEELAVYIWGGEVLLGIVFAAVVSFVSFKRWRRARTRAGGTLSKWALIGGLCGLLGCIVLLGVAITAQVLPSCTPTSDAAYCESRAATLRLQLVAGLFPLILGIGIPLMADWRTKRAVVEEESQSKQIQDLQDTADDTNERVTEMHEQAGIDRESLAKSEEEKSAHRDASDIKRDEDLDISRRLDKDREDRREK